MIDLKIIFTKNKNKLPSDAVGYYEAFSSKKKITILKTRDYKDTLIHELAHFILDVTKNGGFNHAKKHKKLYRFLKRLVA